MLCAVVDVQTVVLASKGQLSPVAPDHAAATFRDFFSSPHCHGTHNDEPSPKKRRISSEEALPAVQSPVNDAQDSVCLVRVQLDLRFPDDAQHTTSQDTSRSRNVLLKAYESTSPRNVRLILCSTEEPHRDIHLSLESHLSLKSILVHLDNLAKVGSRELTRKSTESRWSPLWSQVSLVHSDPSKGRSIAGRAILEAQLFWQTGIFTEEKNALRHSRSDLESDLLLHYFAKNLEVQSHWSVKDFYDTAHVPSVDPPAATHAIPPDLINCKLYPFQARAVNWLLRREKFIWKDAASPNDTDHLEIAPPSFQLSQDFNGRHCFVSHLRRTIISRHTQLPEEEKELRGGILAEEMGLGKTIEIAALICAHRRKIEQSKLYDAYSSSDVVASGATLIITPPSILEQWRSELNSHTPHLKVFHYKGMPSMKMLEKVEEGALIQELLEYDVVLTTYNVLSREIHYANAAPTRELRHAKAYQPRRSPLVQISWWRCCLDEAQMIESGVSAAATVARLIPRINAWAVSGTPLRKNVQDLLGLLIFLRFEPFCSSKALWNRIDKPTFKSIFSRIALRHTKDQIRHELRLPPQRRIVIRMPFSTVEQTNYDQLLQQLYEDCGLTPEGNPANDNCDVSPEKLRIWLTRLRQVCLHPQVGGRNRRALGRGNGPLRTVREVLDVMIEHNDTLLRAEQRDHVLAQVYRAHIICNAKNDIRRSQHALEIYMSALQQAESFADESRRELATEESKLSLELAINESKAAKHLLDMDSDSDDDLQPGRVAALRKALRSALEVQHICTFFVATAYYLTKTNEAITEPESEDFSRLETLEVEYYDKAKSIRKELLQESHSKAERIMRKIAGRRSTVAQIPQFQDYGGIESRKVLERLDRLVEILNRQGSQLSDFRQKVIATLLLPLVDEDEGNETTGVEYEESTKAQDELQVYVTILRAVVADRYFALIGQPNVFIDNEIASSQHQAKEGKGPSPELLLQLAAIRDRLKPTIEDGSLRGVISELRSLTTSLEWSAGNKNARALAELAITERQLHDVQQVSTRELKAIADIDKDMELYRNGMNLRVEFYRQLQHISDMVAPYKEELDDELDQSALDAQVLKERITADRLASLKTKQRFLLHLRVESDNQQGSRLCVICQSTFDRGVLTVCGHQFCKECITHWYRDHRNCPLCKRKLSLRDFYEVSLKQKEIHAQEETRSSPTSDTSSSAPRSSIYSEMSQDTIKEITAIELEACFGTKIDTLCKHLLWIRQHDPGSKSIVFSTHGDFFSVLQDAFKKFKIGFSRIGEKGGIERFKAEPGVETFLLDAKTDASGLNLTCATHVFICEPLINTAIELQAIARVHRIGQQRATTVYCYVIAGSVEENIYSMSVDRRLAHMGERAAIMEDDSTSDSRRQMLREKVLDTANAVELQQVPNPKLLIQKKGGGEVVDKDDVFEILFGGVVKQGKGVRSELAMEVGRHLRAKAADKR